MLVLCGEVVVDWIKHAFITKFNDITPDIYQKYKAILSRDLAVSRHRNVSLELRGMRQGEGLLLGLRGRGYCWC